MDPRRSIGNLQIDGGIDDGARLVPGLVHGPRAPRDAEGVVDGEGEGDEHSVHDEGHSELRRGAARWGRGGWRAEGWRAERWWVVGWGYVVVPEG